MKQIVICRRYHRAIQLQYSQGGIDWKRIKGQKILDFRSVEFNYKLHGLKQWKQIVAKVFQSLVQSVRTSLCCSGSANQTARLIWSAGEIGIRLSSARENDPDWDWSRLDAPTATANDTHTMALPICQQNITRPDPSFAYITYSSSCHILYRLALASCGALHLIVVVVIIVVRCPSTHDIPPSTSKQSSEYGRPKPPIKVSLAILSFCLPLEAAQCADRQSWGQLFSSWEASAQERKRERHTHRATSSFQKDVIWWSWAWSWGSHGTRGKYLRDKRKKTIFKSKFIH